VVGGLPGRRQDAIRCITGTTRPATRTLTSEEPHPYRIVLVSAPP
jgi:hypothetical protein